MTRDVFRGGLTLAGMAAVCTLLVAATYRVTAGRIAANEQAYLERSLEPALSGVLFEGSVSESKLEIDPPHDLPGDDTAVVYRVYAEGAPVAALFAVTARGGYSGPIRILVGVNVDGMVTGVRVVEHRETPGLGDRIHQSRSNWVYQFDGRSLVDPVPAAWLLEVDGGEFDQITGASVTPRAVIKAIRETLVWFDDNRERLFSQPSGEEPR